MDMDYINIRLIANQCSSLSQYMVNQKAMNEAFPEIIPLLDGANASEIRYLRDLFKLISMIVKHPTHPEMVSLDYMRGYAEALLFTYDAPKFAQMWTYRINDIITKLFERID